MERKTLEAIIATLSHLATQAEERHEAIASIKGHRDPQALYQSGKEQAYLQAAKLLARNLA